MSANLNASADILRFLAVSALYLGVPWSPRIAGYSGRPSKARRAGSLLTPVRPGCGLGGAAHA